MADVHEALVYTMVLLAGADRRLADAELRQMGEITAFLPVFHGFDRGRLPTITHNCAAILAGKDGLDAVLDEIKTALPKRLGATAYALACEIAATEKRPTREQLRLLKILRDRLDLDRLTTAAIERTVVARYADL